jgi:hypothetical protein
LKKQTALRLAQEQGIPSESVSTTPETTKTPQRAHRFRSSSSTKLPFASSSDGSFSSPSSGDAGFLSPVAEMTLNSRMVVVPEDDRFANHRSHTPSSTSYSLLSHSVDSATEKGANSKLPHGLTVHELKEMTKARLEAEAVRNDLVPSNIRVASDYSSPPPGVFPSRRSPYPSAFDTEAWESASVSTAASDFPDYSSLGFNGGNHSFHNVDDVVPLTRVPSNHPPLQLKNTPMRFPEWSSPQGENHPPPYGGMTFDADHGVVPNRRRAATLSPRLGLSHVHQSTVPSFSSLNTKNGPTMSSMPQEPTFTRSAAGADEFYCGVRDAATLATNQSVYPPPPMNGGGLSMMGSRAFEANRARTASLPTILSPTHGEDFHCGGSLLFGSASDHPMRDPPPAVAGLSDVFAARPLLFDDSDALAGFHDPTTRLRASSLLDEALAGFDASEPGRLRASSDFLSSDERNWTESAALFCGAADHLSDDLASILKLTTRNHGTSPGPS